MIVTKEKSHDVIYAEDIFKDLVEFDQDTIIFDVTVPIDLALEIEKSMNIDLNIHYVDKNIVCPVCNSHMNCHSKRGRTVNSRYLTLQRYKCSNKDCEHYADTDLSTFVGKWQRFTYDVELFALEENLIDYSSLEKIMEKAKSQFNIQITRQTIFNHMRKNANEFINKQWNEINKLFNGVYSGVVGYDEQYPFVNGEKRVRLAIIDTKTRMIINDETVDKSIVDIAYIENFMRNSLKDIPLKGICTDGVKAYYNIIDNEFQVPHVVCTFHIMEDLMDDNYRIIRRYNKEIENCENKILKLEDKINKNTEKKKESNKKTKKIKQINKKIKEYKKEIKKYKNKKKIAKKKLDELENYIERISNIFKCDSEENAMRRFNLLYNNVEFLPPSIAPFIKRLSKYIDKAIAHIKYDFLDSTNNVTERFFGVTLPGYLKKRFRTDEGLEIRTQLSDIRYIRKNLKTY